MDVVGTASDAIVAPALETVQAVAEPVVAATEPVADVVGVAARNGR